MWQNAMTFRPDSCVCVCTTYWANGRNIFKKCHSHACTYVQVQGIFTFTVCRHGLHPVKQQIGRAVIGGLRSKRVQHLIWAKSVENGPEAQSQERQITAAAPNTTDNPCRGQRDAGLVKVWGRRVSVWKLWAIYFFTKTPKHLFSLDCFSIYFDEYKYK